MPAKGVSMQKIKEVLRLHFESKLSQHQIAASLKLSVGVVNKYLLLSKAAQLEWPLPEAIDELTLRSILRPHTPKANHYCEPDYPSIHQELKCKGVTLLLLWQDYEQSYKKQAYRYAQFCAKYREWYQRQKPSLRQLHRAGEKLFVDYCGPTIDIIDSTTGAIRSASIFVAVLGASNYTYAEATWDQKLPNWIASHVRTFRFLEGVPLLVVPDNLKSGVTKACRYEPKINDTYADLAAHYGTAILPARPYKPKDKAKVESTVLIVERWILAKLRHHTFIGLAELNLAIAKLLQALNQRPFKKLPGTRASQFEVIDKPALKALPLHPYVLATFSVVRVQKDYHIEIEGHYYSVPYSLIKQLVHVRLTASTLECFQHGQRIASHQRSFLRGKQTTLTEHMPPNHQTFSQWSPEWFLNQAAEIGPSTHQIIQHNLSNSSYPEQNYRVCSGILRVVKQYGKERLESACQRALAVGAHRRNSILSILKHGLDKLPLTTPISSTSIEQHKNIRGAKHYHEQLAS